jgi:hypothetical protein
MFTPSAAPVSKKLTAAASLLALTLQIVFPFAALAAPVELKHAEGKPAQATLALPTNSIGTLSLPSGQLLIEGNNVVVGAVPEWLFDRHPVLTGTLIRLDVGAAANGGASGSTSSSTSDSTSTSTSSSTSTTAAPTATAPLTLNGSNAAPSLSPAAQSYVSGLVYINGGDWLKNLRRTRSTETVETTEGSVSGKIASIDGTSVLIETLPGQTKTIPLANVKNIVSPFSFSFTAPATDIKLSPDDGTTVCDAGTVVFAPASQSIYSAKGNSGGSYGGSNSSRKPALTLPKSTLAGTEGGITKGAITAMVAVDTANTLAPIIGLPLTMALGQRRAENTLNGFQNANFVNDFFFKIPLVTSPVARF